MGLKTKVIVILLSLLCFYGIIEYSVQRFIILPRFIELETAKATDNLQRAIHAINREIEHLDTLCHDWASWDDTYWFVEKSSQEYVESNLAFSTFKENGIHLIYICNLQGRIVWGKVYDMKTRKEIKLDLFPGDSLPLDHPFLQFNAGRKDLSEIFLRGVIVTDKGPMLVSSRPILLSGGKGPMHGSFIMGKFLTKELVAMLADQTRVNLAVGTDVGAVRQILERSELILGKDFRYSIRSAGSDNLETITTYPDIRGKPAFVIKTSIKQDIVNRGYATMRYALITLLVAGLIVVVVIVVILERMILHPITNLTDHVFNISRTGNYSSRLSVRRADEIGALAREFDAMLEKIDDMNTVMEKINEQLMEDITKRKEMEDKLHDANKKLHALATMDGLTHLCNRRRFDEAIAIEWKRGIRDMAPLSLIILDVDCFKSYNDTYGHQAGDDCLREIAAVIRDSSKRVTDIPARYGGEEFGIILPNTEIIGAIKIAERIRDRVHSLAIPHDKGARDRRVTISAGVSCMIPTKGTAMDTIIMMADKAMYEAKAKGRNLVVSSLEE